jgi:hypothetical protein
MMPKAYFVAVVNEKPLLPSIGFEFIEPRLA